jgi:hypothetical protein
MSSDTSASTTGPNCAICTNVATSKRRKAAGKVRGYWVCLPHAPAMESSQTLFDALREARRRNAIHGGAV